MQATALGRSFRTSRKAYRSPVGEASLSRRARARAAASLLSASEAIWCSKAAARESTARCSVLPHVPPQPSSSPPRREPEAPACACPSTTRVAE
eukprot:4492893-Alexandrium_andersonii.AAC.1